jgi:hypothetical protein
LDLGSEEPTYRFSLGYSGYISGLPLGNVLTLCIGQQWQATDALFRVADCAD